MKKKVIIFIAFILLLLSCSHDSITKEDLRVQIDKIYSDKVKEFFNQNKLNETKNKDITNAIISCYFIENNEDLFLNNFEIPEKSNDWYFFIPAMSSKYETITENIIAKNIYKYKSNWDYTFYNKNDNFPMIVDLINIDNKTKNVIYSYCYNLDYYLDK